jgi:hypothetical protein
MELFSGLWLPIFLSAIFVFVVSSILHIIVPMHKRDYKKLAGEDMVLKEMRAQGVTPGEYMFPFAAMKEMNSPDVIKKFNDGPVGIMTVLPNGKPRMGKHLVLWFLYLVFVNIFVAYATALGLARGTEYILVFRVTGAIAVLAYVASPLYEYIWKGQRCGTTFRFVVDGVIYGLVTAGTFGWLWPAGM